MSQRRISHLSSFNVPPGGLVIWLFFAVELLTFAILFFAIALNRHDHPHAFQEAQSHLPVVTGAVNTLILLTSGWAMAEFVAAFFSGSLRQARLWHFISWGLGLAFLIFKGVDFLNKFSAGLGLGTSDFWDLYFLSTGFHFVHIWVGVLVMTLIQFQWKDLAARNVMDPRNEFTVKGSAAYWHFCDVLWLFLFSLFYL